jgi:hypothetical protein
MDRCHDLHLTLRPAPLRREMFPFFDGPAQKKRTVHKIWTKLFSIIQIGLTHRLIPSSGNSSPPICLTVSRAVRTFSRNTVSLSRSAVTIPERPSCFHKPANASAGGYRFFRPPAFFSGLIQNAMIRQNDMCRALTNSRSGILFKPRCCNSSIS